MENLQNIIFIGTQTFGDTIKPVYSDMLYDGHLVIAETSLRNRPNHVKLSQKNLYKASSFIPDICCSRHFFGALREHFVQNLLFNKWTPYDSLEKKETHVEMHVFNWHIYLH